MTASPAARYTVGETMQEILQICYDLDCKVRFVEVNESELSEYVNEPAIQEIPVELDPQSKMLLDLIVRAANNIRFEFFRIIEKADVQHLSKEFQQESNKDQFIDIVEDIYKFTSDFSHACQKINNFRNDDDDDEDDESQISSRFNDLQQKPGEFLAMLIQTLLSIAQLIDEESSIKAFYKLEEFLTSLEEEGEHKYLADDIIKFFDSIGLSLEKLDRKSFSNQCAKREALMRILKKYNQVRLFFDPTLSFPSPCLFFF